MTITEEDERGTVTEKRRVLILSDNLAGGTKEELMAAIAKLQAAGIDLAELYALQARERAEAKPIIEMEHHTPGRNRKERRANASKRRGR